MLLVVLLWQVFVCLCYSFLREEQRSPFSCILLKSGDESLERERERQRQRQRQRDRQAETCEYIYIVYSIYIVYIYIVYI